MLGRFQWIFTCGSDSLSEIHPWCKPSEFTGGWLLFSCAELKSTLQTCKRCRLTGLEVELLYKSTEWVQNMQLQHRPLAHSNLPVFGLEGQSVSGGNIVVFKCSQFLASVLKGPRMNTCLLGTEVLLEAVNWTALRWQWSNLVATNFWIWASALERKWSVF